MNHRKGKLLAQHVTRLEALPGWSWDPFADQFEEGYQALKRFVEREGHARVGARHVEDDLRLGAWVSKRRKQYLDGRLEPEQVARLESLPGWSWNLLAEQFERAFQTLESFVAREGHARVPRSHVEGSHRLGLWINDKRYDYRKGKLPSQYIARLEGLPGWSWDPHADQFEEAFQALKRFAEREGHARVASAHVEDGLRLGIWVGKRRAEYRKGKLSPERVAALEAIDGWGW